VSRTERFRPTGAAVVTSAVIGALALAGCGAGQITQTSNQQSAVGGANAGTGAVVVRDARIAFAEGTKGANVYNRGTDAPLEMSIVNSGAESDKLVSVTSPVAASVKISGEAELPGGQVLLVEGEAAAPASAAPAAPGQAGAAPDAPNASPNPSAAPTAAAPSSAAPSSSAEPAGVGGAREAQVVLTGLREDVRAGLTYPIVLTFERAGQISLQVPVGNPSEPREAEPSE
jgi:copper(I)-binding protein